MTDKIDGWERTDTALVRKFVFENQTQLAEFVLLVAKYSDEVNHHADMQISECRKLQLSVTTHDAGGLTEQDQNWAKELNALILEKFKN